MDHRFVPTAAHADINLVVTADAITAGTKKGTILAAPLQDISLVVKGPQDTPFR